jgi:hypothetical protein
MKSLSQSEYGELRSLYESVYAPKFESILDEFTDEDLDDLTDEYIEEQVTEFFQECLEEGFDIEILEETICESIDSELELLSEVTNPAKVAALRAKNKAAAAAGEGSGDAGAKARATLNVSKQKVGSASPEKKSSKLSKIKGAVKKVGKAVQGGVGLAARAVSTAQRAGSAVKSAAKKGYERGKKGSGSESSTDSSTPSSSSSSGESSTYSSTPSSSSSSSGTSAAPKKRKDGLLKRGLKKLVRGVSKGVSAAAGAVKAGADSITDRARKEQMNYNDVATIQELYNQMYAPQDVEEVYKGKHGQSDKEYADSRSQGGKMVSGDSKQSGAEYTHGRRVKAANPGMQPDVGGKTKPKSQGKMDRGTRADIEYRKANLKKEELEATGLFSEMEIEAIMEAEMSEAMSSYDRNRKRAAQRAAARNAARDAGKTGVVPGVGYVTPRRERETYVDSAGTTRHKSGAKMEEVEAVDEGLTGESYKKALKKGKQYSRMVSADPSKRATRGGRGGESDFGAGDRGTGNKSRRRRGMSVGDED